MSLDLPKTCSMGGSHTSLVGTIGVTLLNSDGTTHTARTTSGIYEIGGGCYGKDLTFDDDWEGSILWDTGGGSPVYAVEGYNYLENSPSPAEIDTELTANHGSGLWKKSGGGCGIITPDLSEIKEIKVKIEELNNLLSLLKRDIPQINKKSLLELQENLNIVLELLMKNSSPESLLYLSNYGKRRNSEKGQN